MPLSGPALKNCPGDPPHVLAGELETFISWLVTKDPVENSEALEIAKPLDRRNIGSQIMGLIRAFLPT